jgi:hypothetical protein
MLPFGQSPRRDFKVNDFKQLRWIEGKWKGEANGAPFYERYHFTNDTTIEQESFKDGTFQTVTERATFALRNGRIFEESAKSRYEAVRFNAGVAQFIPVKGASNSFQFTRMSKDRWTATIIPNGGKKKTVYEMRRVQ